MRANVDYHHDVWYQEALLKLSLEHAKDNVIGQTNLQIAFRIIISVLEPYIFSTTLEMNSNKDFRHLT